MKKDMNNHKYYCETFQEVHAPKALAGKVINMTNQNKISFIKKIAVTAASLAALFIGSNAIAYVATGTTWVSGFFKDVTRWDGAVVGTEYVTAPGEIEITVSDIIKNDDTISIPIAVQFSDTEVAPFRYLEELSLGEITLIGSGGTEFSPSADTSSLTYAPISLGTAQFCLTFEADMLRQATDYQLHIKSLYGSSKGDAPY